MIIFVPIGRSEAELLQMSLHDVREVSVNNVSDEVFQFRLQPGSVMSNGSGVVQQVAPGGLDHLDKLVSWIERNALAGLYREKRSAKYYWWMFVPACVAIGVCELIRFGRSRRNRFCPGIPGDTSQYELNSTEKGEMLSVVE